MLAPGALRSGPRAAFLGIPTIGAPAGHERPASRVRDAAVGEHATWDEQESEAQSGDQDARRRDVVATDDRSARHEQARAEAEEQADDLWAGILGSLRGSAPRARLVLNHLNPLIRRISSLTDRELIGTATESLYGQALLMAQRPLRPADSALLNRAFIGLLEWATHTEGNGRT